VSETHYEGQETAECPECERVIRLTAGRIDVSTPVSCGGCGTSFDPRAGGPTDV
jgi:hypothetical protein